METGNPTPLVSVILPFYNAPFLSEAIKSILNQSYTNLELLLIDNGSTDSSKDVAKSYEGNANVRLLFEPRRGVVYAANTGIRNAKGCFIARMDADDVSLPDRLKLQVGLLANNPSIGVASGLVNYLGDDKNEGFIQYVNWVNSMQLENEIYLSQFVEFPLANPTLMFRREVFGEYGVYQEGDFPEDYEFFLRLKKHGVKMSKVQENILQWRDSETRLTRTDERYNQDAFFRIKAKYLFDWLIKHNQFHPNVHIWGAGRLSRRRSDYLLEKGVIVEKYIDLKANGRTISYKDIPSKEEAFIISYVGNRGVREEIRSYLDSKGYIEGVNYIIAS